MLELYVVRNQEGKYFRAKGYGGSGSSWVEKVESARIYARIGPARATVSYFAASWPQYGIPVIVKLTATETEVIDESEKVKKKLLAKEEKKKNAVLNDKKRQIADLQRQIHKLQGQ